MEDIHKKTNKQENQKDFGSNLIPFLRENWTLIAAIVYIVSPIDFIPDVLPLLGWSDDLSILIATLIYRAYQHRQNAIKKEKEEKNNVVEGEIIDEK